MNGRGEPQALPDKTRILMPKQPIRLFISHAAADALLAERLIELILLALNLPADAVRCTSVDGHRLPGGADTSEQLRREVHESEAFIGIVSSASVRSVYVLFELGARWGAGKHLIPLLAPGSGSGVLGGPLAGLNALRADSRAEVHQLLGELADRLEVPLQGTAGFERHVTKLIETQLAANSTDDRHSAAQMLFKAPFYYRTGDPVPHCPRCWESDGKAIHLHGPMSVASGTRFDCLQCEQLFIAERTGIV